MSAPNFITMSNFPLYANDFTSLYCPSCGEYVEGKKDYCPDCGSELQYVVDEIAAMETIQDIEKRLEDANRGLTFHTISVVSGRYYGVQFYVEENHDPNEYNNDDCKYYFDMYRSVAIRRYNSEINKITKLLERLADEFWFDELFCSAVFSNGEAIFTPARKTRHSRVRQAVSPRV